jgi:hypothetical protein
MLVPKNTLDFSDIFHNEEVCLEYFEKLRWPEGIICPACQCKEVRKHKRGYYVCVKCRSDIHQTAGTVFHRSRISLRTLFWLVWLCVSSKQGVSSEELSMSLWIGSRISWQWLHKIRRIMVLEDRTKLSGNVECLQRPWKKLWEKLTRKAKTMKVSSQTPFKYIMLQYCITLYQKNEIS